MAAMLKTCLAATCAFTLLATGYLSLSLIVLHPPRANYRNWSAMAALLVAQSMFTLVALAADSAALRVFGPGGIRSRGLHYALLAGGVAIVWLGASWVRSTVSSPHFEGYALVLGSALVLQGLLTLVVFAGQLGVAAFRRA